MRGERFFYSFLSFWVEGRKEGRVRVVNLVSFSFLLSIHPTSLLGRNKVLCLMQRPYTLHTMEEGKRERKQQRKGRTRREKGKAYVSWPPRQPSTGTIFDHRPMNPLSQFCLFHCVPQSPKTDGFFYFFSLSLVVTFAKWGKMGSKMAI